MKFRVTPALERIMNEGCSGLICILLRTRRKTREAL